MADIKPKTPKELLEEMRKNLDTTVQMQASLSIIMRARYDALLKVGFSEDQAIFLCRL